MVEKSIVEPPELSSDSGDKDEEAIKNFSPAFKLPLPKKKTTNQEPKSTTVQDKKSTMDEDIESVKPV